MLERLFKEREEIPSSLLVLSLPRIMVHGWSPKATLNPQRLTHKPLLVISLLWLVKLLILMVTFVSNVMMENGDQISSRMDSSHMQMVLNLAMPYMNDFVRISKHMYQYHLDLTSIKLISLIIKINPLLTISKLTK